MDRRKGPAVPITTGLTDNLWEEFLFALIKDCFDKREYFIKWLAKGKPRYRYMSKNKKQEFVMAYHNQIDYCFECSSCVVARVGYKDNCEYVERMIKEECAKSVKGSTRLSCYAESIKQGVMV